MPAYLVSMKNDSGRRVTSCVDALTGHDCVEKLLAEGWTDVLLHTDDVLAANLDYDELMAGKLTPADLVALRFVSGWGFVRLLILKMYKPFTGIAAASAATLAAGYVVTLPAALTTVAAILLLVPLLIALAMLAIQGSNPGRRATKAAAWGRWDELLALIPALRRKAREKMRYAIDTQEAAALAGLGRMNEALALLEEQREAPGVARWLYFARLTQIYGAGRHYDRALESIDSAASLAPDNLTLQFDLANHLLLNEREPDRARQLLDQVESKHLADYVQAMLPGARGLLALNRREYASAVRLIDETVARTRPFCGAPHMQLIADVNRGYLAVAYAHLQEMPKAERQWRLAVPRLKALKASRLIDRYAVANPRARP